MSSKRGIRRRKEREEKDRNLRLQQRNEMTSPKPQKVLMGGTGTRASVAELMRAKAKFKSGEMPARPSIQLSKPQPIDSEIKELAEASRQIQSKIEKIEQIQSGVEQPSSIIGSEHHRKLIFEEAKQNREYYLNKQKETGIPWFKNVRKQSQYSEFIMLNSDMCATLLQNLWRDGNRKLKVWMKEAYRRDIEAGCWIPSDEGIGIDFNGVVYNGQHRLTALLESGKEYPFYVTFNCLEEAKFTVDSGAKRSEAEKLQMIIDARLGNRTTGFCKALMRGLNPKKFRWTETEIVDFAFEWQEIITWMGEHLPTARAEVQAAIAKAYLWYGPEHIEPFCERLRGVKFTEDGDPAKALFMVLQKCKVNRIHLPLMAYKKTLSCIEAIVNNKTLSRVQEKTDDIFEWDESWQLPEGSWWKSRK